MWCLNGWKELFRRWGLGWKGLVCLEDSVVMCVLMRGRKESGGLKEVEGLSLEGVVCVFGLRSEVRKVELDYDEFCLALFVFNLFF